MIRRDIEYNTIYQSVDLIITGSQTKSPGGILRRIENQL